ncbi:cytochrome P450 monooxygenase [Fusarium pseudoanthophilum]|uniref:Cytochrome P450 monooxygenase n=1 Tax=Fusarium pseudoanthophilum TaxID=48495 RepID=A0A8H5NNB1_9HYPO|nr:cytochrome P450 monooxygenase [Fusarium pseudoanthophilum]
MSLKIESFINWAIGLPILLQMSTVVGFLVLGYIIYYRYLHPLAKYPGPPLASLTNLWKTYHLWNLHLPHTLVRLHEQYGDVVRVGPNDLSFRDPNAVNTIYKAGRQLQKTGFYDGFTAFNPNLFGTQDEEYQIHAIRRRQMAHAFSLPSIKEMEHFVDSHILKLRKNLDHFCDTSQEFDLKEIIALYVFDVLGELAFSRSFDSQDERDLSRLPPINDHIYLACLMGMTPEALPWIKKVLPFIPIPWIKRLLNARAQLRNLTAACVRQRIDAGTSDRKDLLSSLLVAVDPETGSKLTELDINTEAFAMVVAGSHTTSGTLTLLFSHLLKNNEMLKKVIKELDSSLSRHAGQVIPYAALEKDLPYTMACIQENFRINPVFTMPLPRKIMSPGGFTIQGQQLPQKTTVFALNHVVHHNPSVWGMNHDQFIPDRFLGPSGKELQSYLSPFSTGHLLRNYKLEMLHPEEPVETLSVGISEKKGGLTCALGTIAGATAECFATAGARLFLSDIQLSLPDSTKDRLLHLGAEAVHYHRCDVGNPNECEELVKQAVSTAGDIDVLINGAGVVGIRVFHKQDPAIFLRDMAINFNGPLVLMRLVLPGFIERLRGCVINIASKAATQDMPFNISYCTSKAALVKLTTVLQAEIDEVAPSSDINLYAIHPGAIRSGMKTADGHQDVALGEFPQIMGRFDEWTKRFTGSPHLAGMSCVALATGIAKDALRGRYYDVEQDLEDVISQASLLKADPLLHTLHISMLGSFEREEGAIAQDPEEKFDFPGF